MLIRSSEIRGCIVEGIDGQLGTVDDVYFDAYRWLIDYLVVDMGGWSDDRQALLSPSHIEAVDWSRQTIRVRTTRESLRRGPQIDLHTTVSRQLDERNAGYVWWPPVEVHNVEGTAPGLPGDPLSAETDSEGKPFLRSAEEVTGYVVEAIDGRCGRLLSLLIDDHSWRVASLLVDPGNWLPGPVVRVPVNFLGSFDWLAHCARMTATRDRIRACPKFEPYPAGGETSSDILESRN